MPEDKKPNKTYTLMDLVTALAKTNKSASELAAMTRTAMTRAGPPRGY
jgi:hypothetical protein